jgi:hypothetical protein
VRRGLCHDVADAVFALPDEHAESADNGMRGGSELESGGVWRLK